MRIAGFVPRKQNIEVEYVKSVHTVSRWIHEIFERPEFASAVNGPNAVTGTNDPDQAAPVAA